MVSVKREVAMPRDWWATGLEGTRGRVSAKSAAGGLMSGVVGVLARVRRGPAGTMGGA